MGLKILHSADWHLDSPFTEFAREQRVYLKSQLRKVPGKIADICRRENCDLVLLSGDLFDGPYTRESVAALSAALKRCAVPVLISPGNHDYVAPGSPWRGERWPENVHIFDGALTSVSFPELNCRVYGAGYRSMDCPPLLQDFRAEGMGHYQLAVLHGDPMKLNSPYCPVTAAQVRDSGLHYLALGHIHKAGSFRSGNTLCGWPGVPMGRGYDETREKGVYIVELEERATIRFVSLDLPRFYDLEVDTDRQSPADVLSPGGDSHFYRITLIGAGGEPVSSLKEAYAHFPNLEFIDHREKPVSPWENVEEDTLEGTYFRLLQEKLEDPDPQTARAARLAAEISRKILQGREVLL